MAVSHCPFIESCGICSKNFSPFARRKNELQNLCGDLHYEEISEQKQEFRHRATLRLHFDDKGYAKLGYHTPGSRQLFELRDCPIMSSVIRDFISRFHGLRVLELASHAFRFTVDQIAGDRLLFSVHKQKGVQILALHLAEYGSVHMESGESIFYLYDQQFGHDFYVAPFSFRQSHFKMNQRMREVVREHVGSKTVVDYYCGHGNLSRFINVSYGYDSNTAALAAANLDRLHPVYSQKFRSDFADIETIIVDPPRAGVCHRIEPSKGQELILFACSRQALRGFLSMERTCSMTVKKIVAFNMFPYTDELELMVVFQTV